MKYKQANIRKDERGLVSMVVTVLIITLLALITLAMSRNADREQRQALDRQLSSQAFYAAESGVNNVVELVNNPQSYGVVPDKKESCDDTDITFLRVNKDLTDDGTVTISCLLYDQSPDTLEYGNVATNQSEVIPLRSGSGINNLIISWHQAESDGNVSECGGSISTTTFPPASQYPPNCQAGILRAEIIDARDLRRDSLIDNNFVAFLVPQSGPSGHPVINYTTGSQNQGRIVEARCSDNHKPKKCKIQITGLGLQQNQTMFLRLRSVYKPNTVTISGAQFVGAQIMIDSTGKANDVLRRIQVRVPLRDKYDYPEFAIQSTESICKLLEIVPPGISGVVSNDYCQDIFSDEE